MGKQYEQYAYFNGHRGTHVGNGVYKLDTPYTTDILDAFGDGEYDSYAILYKWVNIENDIIKVMYFKDGYDDRFNMYLDLKSGKYGDSDLCYIQACATNTIGGVHK